MKAFGAPVLQHFAEHLPEAAGYSLVQLIETSAITGHFCDLSGDAYIDIFSCKDCSALRTRFLSPADMSMIKCLPHIALSASTHRAYLHFGPNSSWA